MTEISPTKESAEKPITNLTKSNLIPDLRVAPLQKLHVFRPIGLILWVEI
jgi:hypothetical protein